MSDKEDTKDNENASSKLEDEPLLISVRNQIEYYFSKENLRTDSFLISHMDSQNSVSLAIVMKFAKLLSLTQDENLVKESLESSTLVSLIDGRIKSNVKVGRSTIILREIPSDAPEEEIKEIFSFPGCKPVISIRSEIGDTWFITMESEEDAKDAILDLKLKKRMFRNVPVKARLKSETTVKAYFAPPPPVPFVPMPFINNFEIGYGNAPGYVNNSLNAVGSPSANSSGDGKPLLDSPGNSSLKGDDRNSVSTGNQNSNAPRGGSDRRGNETRNQGDRSTTDSRKTASGSGADRDRDRDRGRNGRPSHDRSKVSGGQRSKDVFQPVIEINAANFPPLPLDESHQHHAHSTTTISHATIIQAAPTATTTATATSMSTLSSSAPAYIMPYIPSEAATRKISRKYTIDDIINIVRDIRDAPLPDTIKPNEHAIAMVNTPNKDLLLRQRTFSIDETREQMQLGKPILRDAVLESTAVDYTSLMYGEDLPSRVSTPTPMEPVVVAVAPVSSSTGTKKSSASATQGNPPSAGSWAGVLMKSGAPPSPSRVESKLTVQKQESQQPLISIPSDNSKASEEKSNVKEIAPTSTPGDSNDTNSKKYSSNSSSSKDVNESSHGKKSDKKQGGSSGGRSSASHAKKNRNHIDKDGGDSSKSGGVPSDWGGRPTFANVLKEASNVTATAPPSHLIVESTSLEPSNQKAGSVNSTKNSNSSSKSNSDNSKSTTVQNNNSKKSEVQNVSKKNSNGGASAATWAKAKLPPLEKNSS